MGSRRLAGGMHLPSHYLLEDKVMEEKLQGIPRIGTLVSVVTSTGLKLAHVTGDAWPADLGVEVPIQFTDGVQTVVYFHNLRKVAEEDTSE